MSWSSNWGQSRPNNQPDYASMPFWDFIQSIDPARGGPGAGVDFAGPHGFPRFAGFDPGFDFRGARGSAGPGAQFRFGGGFGPWGRGGCHGRHCRRPNHDSEDENMADANAATPSEKDQAQGEKSAEGVNEKAQQPADGNPNDTQHAERGFGRHGHGHRGGRRHGHPHPRSHPAHGHGPPSPPPYTGEGPPFDFARMLQGFANHPFAQAIRDYAERARRASENGDGTDVDAFTPPIDIFNTERAFVIHISLPGAKKEDIGVNWDEDKGVLNITGVVYRPGDEAFLSTLSSSERKVGMFEKTVALPPAGSDEKEEVDGFAITAKMEDGILIVTVPKLEKEWTEVRKVDIE